MTLLDRVTSRSSCAPLAILNFQNHPYLEIQEHHKPQGRGASVCVEQLLLQKLQRLHCVRQSRLRLLRRKGLEKWQARWPVEFWAIAAI